MKTRSLLSMIALLVFTNVFAQQTKLNWNSIDSLMKLGLIETASKDVDAIFESSKLNERLSDYFKTLSYKIEILKNKKDYNINMLVGFIDKEISTSTNTRFRFLHSIKAEVLLHHWQAEKWKILQRTNIHEGIDTDILNWTAKDYQREIEKCIQTSVTDIDSLARINVSVLDEVLKGDTASRKYRPTLYDLLVYRAIQFYERIQENQDSYSATPDYFLPADKYVKLKINTSIHQENTYKSLILFQGLLKTHEKDTMAYIGADLKRLKFVRRHFFPGEEFELAFLNALNSIITAFPNQESITEVQYEKALVYKKRASRYNPFSENPNEYKFENKKALEVCIKASQKFPNSLGAKYCNDMRVALESPLVNIRLGDVQIINAPLLASLEYKNLKQIYFRILKLDYSKEQKHLSVRKLSKRLDDYLSMEANEEWTQDLPNDQDLNRHHVDLNMPQLKQGYYVLLGSTSPDFEKKKLIHSNFFWVSDLCYLSRNDGKNGLDIFVMSRKNGNPLEGAKLELFNKIYDYRKGGYGLEKKVELITNKDGYTHVLSSKDLNEFQIHFSYGQDSLIISDYYPYARKLNPKPRIKTQFFTDRKIYRPGQTIYFKGIVINQYKNNNEILNDYNAIVGLYDVNNREVAKQELETNEFGSFSGSFVIPKNLLNGQMAIRSNNGSVSFSVEEYKRPNFEIIFDKIKEQYRLNDTVIIKATVKSFSGNALDHVKLKYNISRSDFFFKQIIQNSDHPIFSGETETDEKGRIEIKFYAEEKQGIQTDKLSHSDFNIELSVTDRNGETQSATKILSIPKINLKLKSLSDFYVEKVPNKVFRIEALNFDHLKQDVNVSISIYKIKLPQKALQRREGSRPDQFVMDQETFYSYFPYQTYDDEDDYRNWDVENQVYQAEINTAEVNGFRVRRLNEWENGLYKIVMKAEDHFDEEVTESNYFALYEDDNNKLPYPEFNWFVPPKSTYSPGDICSFRIGSSAMNANIIYEIHYQDRVILSERLKLSNEQKEIKLPITKGMIGELKLYTVQVFNNKVYRNHQRIEVNDSERELKIRLETYRNILRPGDQEEWKINIQGLKENERAELLVGMYDASLDQFMPNKWNLFLFPKQFHNMEWKSYQSFKKSYSRRLNYKQYGNYFPEINKNFESLPSLSIFKPSDRFRIQRSDLKMESPIRPLQISNNLVKEEMGDAGKTITLRGLGTTQTTKNVKLRTNFKESVFFYPDLMTDSEGNVHLKYTSPDALSKWKFMALAHTKDLRNVFLEKKVITQKELMVQPNAPRFFRQGDTLDFSVKISSLKDKMMDGTVEIKWFDALTNQELKKLFLDAVSMQKFELNANSSQLVKWKIHIPENVNIIKYRIIARTENHQDGEEGIIPVLSNRILITESLPIHLNPYQSTTLKFDRFIESGPNEHIKQHRLKFEISANPNWYAILALPSIADHNGNNALAVFNRYYTNATASYLLNTQTRIKEVFDLWKIKPEAKFLSELEKREKLKSVILEETPWLMEATNDRERMKRLSQFFDTDNIRQALGNELNKLLDLQLSNGSWVWFKGGKPNRYITQSIFIGLTRMSHFKLIPSDQKAKINKAINWAMQFLNKELIKDYEDMKEKKGLKLTEDHIQNTQIQYLYALSYLDNRIVSAEFEKAIAYYLTQAQKFWSNKNNYLQAMIAMILYRNGDLETSRVIKQSLMERAVKDEEMGMYWNQTASYEWDRSAIETQALIIEAFIELNAKTSIINELKKNLLKQKQTQMWNTAKASVEAVFALMLNDDEIVQDIKAPELKMGGQKVKFNMAEAGLSYYSKTWTESMITNKLGNIQLKNPNSKMAWGAIHWQYFEDLDKVSTYKMPISIQKKLFVKEYTEDGVILNPISEGEKIKLGDKVVSRMIVKVDRPMDFVHLKDMRASAFEPLSVISTYQYRAGIAYYMSTKDASTHFYFDRLIKGTYVFEYEMVASQTGKFSNGISTIQSLYAPEFNSHSEGLRVEVQAPTKN